MKMKQAKDLIAGIMKRYSETMEQFCIRVGDVIVEVTECVEHYGVYVLVRLVVVLAWLLLAATMPAWYLPYKYFTRKGAKKDEQKAEEKGV